MEPAVNFKQSGTLRSVTGVRSCGLVALGGVGCSFLALRECRRMISGPPLVSDAQLLAQFERTRLELDRLRKMAEADGLSGRIHSDYFDDQRLSKLRLQQYRQLMKTVGVDRLACTGRCQHIEFNVAGTGWHDIGNYKGFYYSPGEPANRTP